MPAVGGVNDMATDRIIDHLRLPLFVDRPPPFHFFEQVMLAPAEENVEYV